MGLIEDLRERIIWCDPEGAEEVAERILEAGIDPLEAIDRGISEAAREVGRRFEEGEYFLSHLMLAGEAMKRASGILMRGVGERRRRELEARRVGRVVIATVRGDIHDIGKNIVALLLRARGFEVYDLGVDVESMEIIDRALEYEADIIALSALMTTTLPSQREVLELLRELGLRGRFKVMVGGGATTREWAERIGADGWAETAVEAVEVALKLVGGSRWFHPGG